MTPHDYVFVFILAAGPFMPFEWVYSCYKQALKSDDPFETFGLNRQFKAQTANIMSCLVACTALGFLIVNSDNIKKSYAMNWEASHYIIALIFSVAVIGWLFVLLESYILGHRLQRKFPDKITTQQINRSILRKLFIETGFLCLFSYLFKDEFISAFS